MQRGGEGEESDIVLSPSRDMPKPAWMPGSFLRGRQHVKWRQHLVISNAEALGTKQSFHKGVHLGAVRGRAFYLEGL